MEEKLQRRTSMFSRVGEKPNACLPLWSCPKKALHCSVFTLEVFYMFLTFFNILTVYASSLNFSCVVSSTVIRIVAVRLDTSRHEDGVIVEVCRSMSKSCVGYLMVVWQTSGLCLDIALCGD